MSFGTDGAIRALEERRNNNIYHIDRLLNLCKVLAQREAESTSSSETDDIRGEISRYRHEISSYELDTNGIAEQLRELKSRSGT